MEAVGPSAGGCGTSLSLRYLGAQIMPGHCRASRLRRTPSAGEERRKPGTASSSEAAGAQSLDARARTGKPLHDPSFFCRCRGKAGAFTLGSPA